MTLEALAREIEDPATDRPGRQRRRQWADRLRREAAQLGLLDSTRLAALIKDAYYGARDNGGTMHTAADDAAARILAAAPRLWLVEIAEPDWDYDRFAAAVVWAKSPEEAETIVRAALRYPDQQDDPILAGTKWIESPEWSLDVKPAPASGIALTHWHAG